MPNIIIFGNSGSGKSILAKSIASTKQLAHLDLDTLAWMPTSPPQRMPIAQSAKLIDDFVAQHDAWVIEGCYADLIEITLARASHLIFLDLPIDDCIANARARPWEPHKYESKAAQDANLDMLIDWIRQYEHRDDSFSRSAHQTLFEKFQGEKRVYTSNGQYELDV